ncbi:hypothetical protein [Acinetobacter indicus]|uniref:hypothetical protein n=1 Tax=Acinetobacter indicus TaxID=756892 RepID=UPI0009D6873B|nr:hypothetical protein [Acinetobacter indicus]
MTLIRKQNAVDIYAAHEGRFVVIHEEDGFYDPQNGETVDVFINIDVTHIDTVIEALQAAKKEILDR